MTSRASSSFSYVWTYDVFLSFRGEDTRHGFTGYLYKALVERGIRTFIDDKDLQRGEQITPSLLKAIEDSRIAITVLSKNYASSSFCLNELAKILECIKGKGRLVLPVFYKLDPSEVRHQTGSYGEALAKHEVKFKANNEKFKDNMENLEKWRMALHQAASMSGLHFEHGNEYEYKFVEKIVKEVSNKINRVPLHVADYPVGLESRVLEVNSLLDVGSDDGVHMVGIHGIGGIGKTTVSLAVYNLIADHFEGLCFLENVREISNKHGLVHLQKILLSQIVEEKKIKLASVKQGVSIIRNRLKRKKVLLILDDVDKPEQLQAIAGEPNWFGSGSRVIITTRDKQLLAYHGVERTYEVEGLNKTEALELLTWKAFKTSKVSSSYVDSLDRAATYASGLPLALEVIGSNLFGKSIEQWISALAGYERIPNKEIQKILKVSFDALEEDQQTVFLDIACCFKGYELAEVEYILFAHHGVCPKYSIEVLVEKSLIKINRGLVALHDLIQDMGREIVRQESPENPGKRSRLWLSEDTVQVLEDNTGTSKIQIIVLDKFEVDWDGEAFKKMNNLKTLIIKKGHFSKGPKYLPNSLRVLEWWQYPSQSLPSDFHPKKLTMLKLPRSCFMSLPLPELPKKFVNMRILNFDFCRNMTEIPDVSGVPNLEELSFQYCENLTKIHDSVGFLNKLRILDAESCEKLRSFPPIKLTSLKYLHLSYCSSLESFPEILGEMENITQLDLQNTPIKELPFSIRNLTRLRTIELFKCGMVQLPSSIVMLPELKELSATECQGLRLSKQDEGEDKVSSIMFSNMECLDLSRCNISDEFLRIGLACFANVKKLDLSRNNFTVLPACIEECRFLRSLTLDDCELLREIRGIPPNLETFSALGCRSLTSSCTSMLLNQELHKEGGNKMFCLPGTRIPDWFEHSSRGPSISFWFRNKFPAISYCFVAQQVDYFYPNLIINGNNVETEFLNEERIRTEAGHIFIFGKKQIKFKGNMDEVLLENDWNHVVVSAKLLAWPQTCHGRDHGIIQTGLYVFKQKSSIEDILFTDPQLLQEKHRVDTKVSRMQFMQRQKNSDSLALLEPHVGHDRELLPPPVLKSLNDNVNWDSNSMVSTQISSTTGVQGCETASRKRKIDVLSLDNEASEPLCQAHSKVVLDSNLIISSFASDTASKGGLEEERHLTSIIQQSFEGCDNVNEAKGKRIVACNSNDGEHYDGIPLLELLPETKVVSDKKQDASNEETISWDPMELEYHIAHPKHHE